MPALKNFQDEHGPLTLSLVGNWDESMVDLCDYAQVGNYWCLQAFGNSVLVPYERSPHFTIILGFLGPTRLVAMLIRKGDSYMAPHPANAQCLSSDHVIVIAQSPTGWVDTRLKTAFLRLQVQSAAVPAVGAQPCWFNVDGHDSNTRNDELRDLCIENRIGLICPPSHTSAASRGRTQQCDLPARLGGPIARTKALFRRLMRKQHRAALERPDKKGQVSVPEIAALLEMAIQGSWDGAKAAAMNEEVGYYVDPSTGRLAWDLTRRLTVADAVGAGDSAAAAQRVHRQEAAIEAQESQRRAIEAAQAQVSAAGCAIGNARAAPVARPAEPVPRANKRSLNAGGCYVTGSMHGQQRAADQQAAEEKAQAKEERAASVWTDKRRADVGKAEALLAECGGSVQVLGERTGGVGLLKALIWSRTGKGPKAKNNTHGAITVEAQAACTARATTLCLQHDDDALQLAGAEDGASAEEEDGGDDGYVAEEPED